MCIGVEVAKDNVLDVYYESVIYDKKTRSFLVKKDSLCCGSVCLKNYTFTG